MKDQLQPVSKTLQRGEKTEDSQAWHRVETFTDNDGNTIQVTNIAYMELASGMHYREDGEWRESQALIESYPTGAIARHGRHKVIFSDNLASDVVVDLQMPDGNSLQSRVLGLFYFDTESGRSVLLAEATNSVGRITESNRVIYADAFTGLNADLRYTYRKSGLEQDIILREQPAKPETYGLNPATTKLQAITEFLSPPTPEQRSLKTNNVEDVTLDFGSMRMILGKAFTVDAENDPTKKVPVSKCWLTVDGRTVLIEEVALSKIQKQLNTLPERRRTSSFWRKKNQRNLATVGLKLPAKRTVASLPRAMQMASIIAPSRGLVLDYVIVGSSVTNYTFKGDTTYLILDEVNTFGTTTIEGGAVIKFDSDDTDKINVIDPQLVTATEAYRPAILTAKDDDSVGEIITGSSGSPSGYYGNGIVFPGDYYSVPTLRYLNFRHLRNALSLGFDDSQGFNLEHSQIVYCQSAIFLTGSINLRNCLFNQVNSIFTSIESETFWVGEHLTVSDCYNLANAHKPDIQLKNSIVAYVQNLEGPLVSIAFWNNSSTEVISGGTVFKTAGSGVHYLKDGSSLRNSGTATITPSLVEELKLKTTYAPPTANILDNTTIANGTTWSPSVQRDNDNQPDLGYHYDPLDYCVSRVTLGGTLTVQSGTVIGFFGTNGFQSGTLNIQGSPLNRSKVAHYSAVQEQSAAWGANAAASYLLKNGSMPTTTATFTDISTAGGPKFGGDWVNTLTLSHSSLYGAKMSIYGGIPVTQAFTNNSIQRSTLEYGRCSGVDYQMRFVNNLFLDSKLSVGEFCNVSLISGLTVRNNLFAKSTFTRGTSSGYAPTVTHNGYNASTVTSQGTSAKTVTSLDFVPGTLGEFYYPTTVNGLNLATLINSGYTAANNLSLCPFTVRTDQTREGTTTADIGFHYVALDTGGNPQDDNFNNTPDYVETPVADSQTVPIACNNSPLTITLTGSGITCGPLAFAITTQPLHGTLGSMVQVNDTTVTVVYTPVSTYCGTDQFNFVVKDNGKISVPATVSLSFASADATADCKDLMVAANTTTTFTLTGSGGCITPFTKLSDPAVGQITQFNPTTGQVTYESGATVGDGSFSFSVANCGQGSPTAEVTIKVVPAPVLTTECRPTSIVLSWTLPPFLESLAASGYIQDFQIFRCTPSSGNSCTPSTASLLTTISDPQITQNSQLWKFVDTTVNSGQTYCYSIKFRHQNSCAVTPPLESPISAPVCATTCCPPPGDFWTDSNCTPQQLAENLMAGAGISVIPNSANFTGVTKARGLFGNGFDADLPFNAGIILSSGDIALAKGPNLDPEAGSINGLGAPPVPDLNNVISPYTSETTFDGAVLEFDVATSIPASITFQYVFASEEYPDYQTSFDDVVGIFVDGVNKALVPNTAQPISVFTVNSSINPQFFLSNPVSSPTHNIQYNGLTVLLTAQANISPNTTHHIKIAIADTADRKLDSAVFIKIVQPCP